MPQIKFYKHEPIPMEMHKVKIVQQLNLLPAAQRLEKMREAGFNTFQLRNRDIFMDMLTDSGVNAMSDNMQAAMMRADDAYAGSETFFRMKDKLTEIFGFDYCLPAHQGRACENILATHFVKPGNCVIMNYHFTTAKAHITRMGGHVEELVKAEGLVTKSDLPFKGNIDLAALEACIIRETPKNIPFVRLEAGTNLIGGQPMSYANMKAATDICRKYGITTVLDASLLQDNLYFIKTRETALKYKTVREITRMIADLFDIIYFSARKFGFARGGAILIREEKLFREMEDLVPMFEGFLTYGGMSVKEMEAMTVGFDESMEMDVISQGPQFIEYCVRQLDAYGIPVITPGGGLGAHVDARAFLEHIPDEEYPAGALVCALYICSGIRGMERGTLSEERNPDGSERIASMELVRLALPRRVFTLSQTEYAIDRLKWLYDHRHMIGGVRFTHEPKTLRFFTGLLEPTSDWPEKLAAAYIADFGDEQ
ncbi:MAG: tryptophanase [Oscillospiraceae bacterium]|nr:tryptophanase [Oscillospiraceae bacterium]